MDRPFCLTCGRPMERVIIQGSSKAAWECPEACARREPGSWGAYYGTRLGAAMEALYPNAHITAISLGLAPDTPPFAREAARELMEHGVLRVSTLAVACWIYEAFAADLRQRITLESDGDAWRLTFEHGREGAGA